jgi:hypothetical protein
MDLLDAFGQLGTAADKITGGRALRGTLAGKPRELLSVLPFSDSMGITDAHDATSGRDLTDAYGLTSKGDRSFGAHALGFLADSVLSPGNLLGAAAAYRAAPTLAKGLAAGAKAASGLDLFEHVGQGLGRFLGDEAGHLKIPKPYFEPNPIDVATRKNPALNLESQSMKPQRFSTDPAKRQFYADWRQARYADRMGGKPVQRFHAAMTGADFGMPHVGADELPHWLSDPQEQAIAAAGNAPWQHAVSEGDRFGIDTRKYSPQDVRDMLAEYGEPASYADKMPAFYLDEGKNIGLNGGMQIWDNPQMMSARMQAAHADGHFSSPDPNALVHHEIGHALHSRHIGDDLYDSLRDVDLAPSEEEILSHLVGRYAATSPHEAVAEIVGPLLHGRTFNEGKLVAQPLQKYGGPDLWAYLGDNGYLKGLGFGALAMLGLGGHGNGSLEPRQPQSVPSV